ncbi:MAG: penicillin-binding transpeptidase domain-containing protein [Verrucomicrobiia bacterium]
MLNTLSFTPEQFDLLKDAMVSVTEEGTGRRAQVSGIQVAGKTGTAQVGSKTKPRQIAWFAGFLPDNPRYSFAVMVEGSFLEESLRWSRCRNFNWRNF